MNQKSGENAELAGSILDFARHVAGQCPIAAVALVDRYSIKTPNERVISEVMVVIHDFQPRLLSYIRVIGGRTVFFFAVDQWIFERDIDRGFLGEAIAGKLIFPHQALQGSEYLGTQEVMLKKRLILELLENLVLSFPELVPRMQIKPQYFLYEVASNRIRVFPLLAYDVKALTDCLVGNEVQALGSYTQALKQLSAEGKINLADDTVTITKTLIAQCQDPKIRILNLTKNAPRTIFNSILGVAPQLINVLTQNTEAFLRTQKINWLLQPENCHFIDPQKYVYVPTADGYVSLAEKVDVRGFAQRMLLKGKSEHLEVEPMGGMLNDVYLIDAQNSQGETKVLAKRFKDWSGFKWFPLTVWSFGARSFSVSGQARLAKECATSEFLHNEGFNVPKILHVSNAERIVFMEFIEGENLSQAVKRIAVAEPEAPYEKELLLIERTAEILAKVHSHNVSLGDTKPDNMIIKPDGTIYLIDFEQALQGGDKAWDVAVFLYYCGHYLQQLYSNGKAEAIAKAFIRGYLSGGGNLQDIKKAGDRKYTRVFSIFTMPPVMMTIASTCKKAENPK